MKTLALLLSATFLGAIAVEIGDPHEPTTPVPTTTLEASEFAEDLGVWPVDVVPRNTIFGLRPLPRVDRLE